MYITDTSDKVRVIIENLESKKDISKLKFLIYVFGVLNNGQINENNNSNPSLNVEEDYNILNPEIIGLSNNTCTILLQYFSTVYNNLTEPNAAYEENGNIIGVEYDNDEVKILSEFEKLTFIEKLDILSEIIIRYDNGTYFDEEIKIAPLDSRMSGYDIAKIIQNYKNNII